MKKIFKKSINNLNQKSEITILGENNDKNLFDGNYTHGISIDATGLIKQENREDYHCYIMPITIGETYYIRKNNKHASI